MFTYAVFAATLAAYFIAIYARHRILNDPQPEPEPDSWGWPHDAAWDRTRSIRASYDNLPYRRV